jgi:hypothetical protein
VVKPDKGIGQTAVNRAETVPEALMSVEEAFAATENGTVVVQELVEGQEIGVNGIVVSGRFHLMTTSYRRSSRERGPAFGVAMEKIFPAVRAPESLATLTEIMQVACRALAINQGPVYAQVIVTPGPGGGQAFTVIEIMPRLGGGEDPRLVRAATGFNLAKATALMCLGQPVALANLFEGPAQPAAVLRFLRTEPGRVLSITGIESARATPGVVAADVFIDLDQVVGELSSSRERAGYVLATGPDPDVAVAVAELAEGTITIRTARQSAHLV